MSTLSLRREAARASAGRIGAMVLRHLYLLKTSWPRLLELMYWPTVQMILWGLVSTFLLTNSSWVAQASGVLLAGVILWDVLFRGQLGLSLVFIEEMWSRNLGHLFSSPLRPWELIVALMMISLLRTLIGMGSAVGFSILLYHFSIFDLGLSLLAFFFNLIFMGWAVGLVVCGLVLRYGLGAESLAWFMIFAFAPVSCIYYPLEILPDWLKHVAEALPSALVFEGMRSVLFDGVFRYDLFWRAMALNALGYTLADRTTRYAEAKTYIQQAYDLNPEDPAVLYLSEVSHHHGGKAYCFGGGLYIDPVFPKYPVKALVSSEPTSRQSDLLEVEIPDYSAIDYYAMIDATSPKPVRAGDTVVFGFRGQAFVTRALVVGISGVSTGTPAVTTIENGFGDAVSWPGAFQQ